MDVRVKNKQWIVNRPDFSSLSVRAENVILNNCSSLEEFRSLTELSLMKFKNCGKKTTKEILKFLSELPFSEKQQDEEINPSLSLKEVFAAPPQQSSLFMLPFFSSRNIKDLSENDLHSGFHASDKLTDYALSTRTATVLSQLGLKTIGELLFTPGSSLLRAKNFGRRSLNELREFILSICQTGNGTKDVDARTSQIDYTSYLSMIVSFIKTIENNQRNQELFLKQLYCRKEKLETLEELGQYFDVTRERVRQIQLKLLRKARIKINLSLLDFFWKRIDSLVVQGGGIIYLEEIPAVLQNCFKWEDVPNYVGVGALLNISHPKIILKDKNNIFTVNTECITCDKPLEFFLNLDFDTTESFHVRVIAEKLSVYCQTTCPINKPVMRFHRAFIDKIVDQSNGQFVLYGDIVLSYDKWAFKYCENLEEIACHVLKSHGKAMHFSDLADIIRHENIKYSEISDHNLHAAIIRYNTIEIVARGTYALKSWGMAGYRSVSTAIDSFIDEKGLPQRRQDIIIYLGDEFNEGNITAALAKESRFKSMGDGFYDRINTWQQRSCLNLIDSLPHPVAEFARYLVGKKNHTSYKLVMAFVFIRSMDEEGSIYLSKLKDMFYNFYLSRHKKGLVVEVEGASMRLIGELSAEEIKYKVTLKPLKSFQDSGFFIQFLQKTANLQLIEILVVELKIPSVRDLMLIVLLKAMDDYFEKIENLSKDQHSHGQHHNVEKISSPIEKEDQEAGTITSNARPTISIKKKKRDKIKL